MPNSSMSERKKRLARSGGTSPARRLLLTVGEPVLFARVAEDRNRVLGQELTGVEGHAHADLLR